MRSPVLAYRHPERSRGIFAIRGQGFTRSPHVPRTSPLSSSVFHPSRTLSGSLRSPPSPRGEGFIRRYSFSTYACIRFEAMGEAVFSYRSLPHGGRLTIRDMLFFHLFSCPPGCFCFLPSHSPVFPCARKISRCARNDEGREDSDTGKDILSFGSPTFSAKRSHFLRKERLRNHHSPPILSAFSHRLAPRGSSMDFFKNKRVSPHFLQI